MANRKQRVGLALVILAMLAGGLLWWLGRAPASRFAQRDSSRRVDRAGTFLHRASSAENGATRARWLLEAGIADRRVAGTVVADGTPVAGAKVQLRGEYFSLAGTAPPTTTTDAEGHFDFGPQPAGLFAAVALLEPFRPGRVRVNLRNPREQPMPDALVIELSPCTDWVFGQVRDAYGGLVTGGVVSVTAAIAPVLIEELYSLAIEDDGSFSLCRPPDGHMVIIKAEGYGSVDVRGPMPPDGWDVRLFPAGSIEGLVVDVNKHPIEAARLFLMRSFSSKGSFRAPLMQRALSQADGSFRFSNLPPGSYEISADDRQHYYEGWAPIRVTSGETTGGVLLEMVHCRSLAGLVLLGNEPVVGARVGPGYQAITQEDGSFLVVCADSDELEFKVGKYDVVDGLIPAGEEDIDDLMIQVQARSTVTGRVTADNLPVKGAIVTAPSPSEFLSVRRGEHYRAETDANGRYQLDGLSPGAHEISALDPTSGRRSKPTIIEVTGHGNIIGPDLELRYAAGIAGIIVDPEGTPVPHVEIHLSGGDPPSGGEIMKSMPGESYSATSDQNGAFRIGGLAAASYRMCLGWCYKGEDDPRYLPLEGDRWPNIVVPSDDKNVEVQLVVRSRMGLSITGTVLHDDGTPVPAAQIYTGKRDAQTSADLDGTFVLTGLTEGQYELHAQAEDGSRGKLPGVIAGANDVRLLVPRVGAIRGSIIGGTGDCSVDVAKGLDATPHKARAVRAFAFRGVEPGEYQIEARCEDGVASKIVTVAAATEAIVDMVIGEPGTIEGTARRFPDGEPISGIPCGAGPDSDTTDSSGAFKLTHVVPGGANVFCGNLLAAKSSMGFAKVSVPADGTVRMDVFIVEGLSPGVQQVGPAELLGATLTPAENPNALVFTNVAPAGPAAAAGIEESDVLIAVAGASIGSTNWAAANAYLLSRPPGAQVPITIRRDSASIQMTLLLGGQL